MAADLDTLIDLHGARWSARGSTAFAGARRDLHHDFAAQALARGWLRLWLLEIDGRAVAAWYGFRYAGAEWYYQSGRDMSAEDDAVGFVLLCHTIREAMNDGMREYRQLRGDEAYKARFADRGPRSADRRPGAQRARRYDAGGEAGATRGRSCHATHALCPGVRLVQSHGGYGRLAAEVQSHPATGFCRLPAWRHG